MALQDALNHYGRFNRSPSRDSNLLASEVEPFKPSCAQCDPFIPWNTVCPREMTTDSRFQNCGCQQKTSLKFEPYVSVKENNLHESNSGGTCKLPLTPARDLDILELMEELKSSSKLPRFSSATGSIVDPFQMAPGRGKWYNLSNNSLSSNSSATFPRSQRKLQIANASLTPPSCNLTNIAKGDACGTSQCTSKHLLPIISVSNSACRTSSCSQDPQHNVTSFPAFLPSELVESMDDLPSATCSTKSSMSEVLQDDGDFRRCNEKLSWSSIAKSGQGYADLTTLSEVIDPSMTELPKIAAPARISSRRPTIASDDFTAAAATQMHEGTEESTAWLSKDEDMENFNASEGGEAAVDSIGVARNDISNTPEHNLGSQYFINTQKYAGQCRAFPSPDQFRAQRPDSSFVANSAPFALNAENICTAELLPAGKEMLYRAAALQPLINLSAEVISKPKRRNVRISKDPQSVAARHRRERISDRIRILQRLVPGGTKMDTASMLDEAVQYVKYLKMQIQAMEAWSYTAGVGWPVPSSSYIGSASTRWEMGSQTGVSSTVKGDCSWKLGSKPAIGGSNYKMYIGE